MEFDQILVLQIVSGILAYLPASDLISCTRVNSVWEDEARKHLNLAPTIQLCCSSVDQYFDTMDPRGHRHSTLKLSPCHKKDCLDTLVAKLTETNCLPKVTFLSTYWDLDSKQPAQFLAFCNLSTLEWRLRRCSNVAEFQHFVLRFLIKDQLTEQQPAFTLSSVKTLVWHGTLSMDEDTLPKLISILPNVTAFTLWNVEKGPILAKLSSLFCSKSTIVLTRLEFNICRGREQCWNGVLVSCAPILEHLSIRGVKDVTSGPWRQYTEIILPILPQLKEFRILRTRTSDCVELKLRFVTATPERTLDYSTQFPALVRLELGLEEDSAIYNNLSKSAPDDDWFETWLPFLYETFLPPTQETCRTLRLLIIATPPRFKTRSCSECVDSEPSEEESWKKQMSEFCERVKTTFPNLRNGGRYKHVDESLQERKLGDE